MDVVHALSRIIDSSTIIVGHSLSCDFAALGIVHLHVIDTAALFPHKQGWPFKRGLRDLAVEFLMREVQTGDCGHCPISDALVAFELAIYFISTPEECRASFLPAPWANSAPPKDRHTLFHHMYNILSVQGCEATSQLEKISIVCHSYKGNAFDMAEKFSLGGGVESDVAKTHAAFERDSHLCAAAAEMFQVRDVQHDSVVDAMGALCADMRSSSNIEQCETFMHCINIPCDFTAPPCGPRAALCSSHDELDSLLVKLEAAAPAQSMLLVLTQEDLSATIKLFAKKQRYRVILISLEYGICMFPMRIMCDIQSGVVK